jgi:hypothetical protein
MWPSFGFNSVGTLEGVHFFYLNEKGRRVKKTIKLILFVMSLLLNSCTLFQQNVISFVRNKDGACDALTGFLTLDGVRKPDFTLLPGQETGESYATKYGEAGRQTIEITVTCTADGLSTELTKKYDFATPYLIWEIRVKDRNAPKLVFGPV